MKKAMNWLSITALLAAALCYAGCSGTGATLNALNPRGVIEHPPATGIQPRVDDLDGKVIAMIDNTKAGARNFLNAVQSLLQKNILMRLLWPLRCLTENLCSTRWNGIRRL